MEPLSGPRDLAGLVTRRSLLASGRSAAAVRAATRPDGPLVVVRRGVYVASDQWAAADEVERWRLRDRAAHLTARRRHLLSHDSAARSWGISLLPTDDPLTHLTRPDVRGARTEHGVKHHLARGLVEPEVVAGLPVTGLARTALDLAREHGAAQGAVAVTEALRRDVDRSRMQRVVDSMWCWPGSTQAQEAVLRADPGSESVGEVLTLGLVRELGFGEPVTQVAVRLADGRLVWCDIGLGRHMVEFDGRVKYRRAEDGGVADRDPGEVVWAERQRERGLLAQDLGVSRLVWGDLWGEARAAARDRLRREVLATWSRWGRELAPEVLELNARLRPGRVPWAYGASGCDRAV